MKTSRCCSTTTATPDPGPLYTYDFKHHQFKRRRHDRRRDGRRIQQRRHRELGPLVHRLPATDIFSPTPPTTARSTSTETRSCLWALKTMSWYVLPVPLHLPLWRHHGRVPSTPWSDLTGITYLDENNRTPTADMDISAGNFEPGIHRLSVRHGRRQRSCTKRPVHR